MRQLYCIHCGIIIRGNFRGKNEFVRYPKGLLHESCKTEYDKKRDIPWSKYVMQHRNKETYNKYMREYMRQYKNVKVL